MQTFRKNNHLYRQTGMYLLRKFPFLPLIAEHVHLDGIKRGTEPAQLSEIVSEIRHFSYFYNNYISRINELNVHSQILHSNRVFGSTSLVTPFSAHGKPMMKSGNGHNYTSISKKGRLIMRASKFKRIIVHNYTSVREFSS